MSFYYQNYIIEQFNALIFTVPAVLFAVICHEYAHGKVSDYLGDPTPRSSGRLTMNPFRHLDILGTICMLLFHVGWAKPVPINSYYYRNRKRGIILVSFAGPVANLLAAFLSVLVEGVFLKYGSAESQIVFVLILFTEYSAKINIGLALFNLIPIPPLDGSKILEELSFFVKNFYRRWMSYWKWILLILVVTGVLSGPLSVLAGRVFEIIWNFVMKLLGIYIEGGIV